MNVLKDYFNDNVFYQNANSEALIGFRYNEDKGVLEVCFQRQKKSDKIQIYRYIGVPKSDYEDMIDEEKWRKNIWKKGMNDKGEYSLGKAFNGVIRTQDFDYNLFEVPAKDVAFEELV